MEFNTITLDMIFALGIKEFSCVSKVDNKIDQIKIEDNDLYFWGTENEGWEEFFIRSTSIRNFLGENYYPNSFFTWEIVNNEV